MKRVRVNRAKVFNLLRVTVVASLLIFGSVSWAMAGQGDDLFARGNQAYSEGKYDEALSFYERVIQDAGYSASLLFNMANAYYRKKDVGQAVLHYERALYLNPGNADIRANLALARKDFGLISDPVPAWQRPFDLLNLNGWALVVSAAFGVFSLMLLLRGIRPTIFRGASFRAVTVFSLLFLLTGGVGMTLQYRNLGRGVVTQDHAQLLVSPFDSAASAASIENGKIVRMARTYRDYVLVKGENGQSGWIKKDAVQPVITSGSCS
jgi:tetratricopeptide (TPR) repeat protein